MALWTEEDWIKSSTRPAQTLMWRAVEAQHVVATMGLADSLEEQYLLEQILDASKPSLPAGHDAAARQSDFLLFTPFRYISPHPSRFRCAGEPGVWYGAETRETACA